jgi:hypothetical protein
MKRINEEAGKSRTRSSSEFAEAVEDHQSNQEAPEDHSRDEEGQPLVHTQHIHGRHLG